MYNVKQKILNIILTVVGLLCLVSCASDTPQAPALNESPEAARKMLDVAILMPLSGPNAVLGQQYDHLIRMGLEDGAKTNIKITSYDGSDQKQILHAMDKIVARNTKIILGPLYSPLASLIADKAEEHNIILLTLSNDPTIAHKNLFVFGHAPLKQLETIMNYHLDHGYRNYITFLPAGNHSASLNKIIQDMIIQKNATLIRAEFYLNSPESIDKSLQLISDNVDNINEVEDDKKPVIYISDDNKSLSLIFGSINKYNLDKKAIIIGDNRIDFNFPKPIDISFTGSLNIMNSNVMERAKNLGIAHMSFLHTMSYDLGRMTAEYMGVTFLEEKFLDRLNSKEPFIGISGEIYFIDSIAQRRYDIIRRENNQYSTITQEQ